MDIKPNSVIHLEPGETLPGYSNLKPVPDKYFDELKALINKLNTQYSIRQYLPQVKTDVRLSGSF